MRNVISSKFGTGIPQDLTWIFPNKMVKSQRVESWNCLPIELHIAVGGLWWSLTNHKNLNSSFMFTDEKTTIIVFIQIYIA